MSNPDQELFTSRPVRQRGCPRCHGEGVVTEAYALASCDRFDGAPENAVCALVCGAFDIFTASREAVEIAQRATRPVAFEFNQQIVVVNGNDDPEAVVRSWRLKEFAPTPPFRG